MTMLLRQRIRFRSGLRGQISPFSLIVGSLKSTGKVGAPITFARSYGSYFRILPDSQKWILDKKACFCGVFREFCDLGTKSISGYFRIPPMLMVLGKMNPEESGSGLPRNTAKHGTN